jgi:hypothetical protein
MSTSNNKQTRDFQHHQWQKEVATLKEAVKIDPKTGMPNNIGALVQMCHDIIDKPRSADSLMAALFDISQTTQQSSYPSESRKTIIDAFEYLLKASNDPRVQTQLPVVIRRLKCIDNPEPPNESLIRNSDGYRGPFQYSGTAKRSRGKS